MEWHIKTLAHPSPRPWVYSYYRVLADTEQVLLATVETYLAELLGGSWSVWGGGRGWESYPRLVDTTMSIHPSTHHPECKNLHGSFLYHDINMHVFVILCKFYSRKHKNMHAFHVNFHLVLTITP